MVLPHLDSCDGSVEKLELKALKESVKESVKPARLRQESTLMKVGFKVGEELAYQYYYIGKLLI